MLEMIRRFCIARFVLSTTMSLALIGVPSAFAQGSPVIDAIVQAHGAALLPPISVQMVGTVERDNKPEPFRLIATRDEQRRIEYGSEGKDTVVSSQKGNFSDDGQKSTYSKVPSGFSQLDITGLFLIQQLRNRAIRVEQKPESVTVSGIPARWLRVEGERTQLHSAKNIVKDQFDAYVSAENGLLLAIARSFYEGRPERYTLTVTFSDYRKTQEVLLPYRIEVYLKGKKTQTYVVQSYQFDAEASRDQFMARRSK